MVSSIMFTDCSSLIPLNRCSRSILIPRCVAGQFRLQTTGSCRGGCTLSVRNSSSAIPAISVTASLSSSYMDLSKHNSIFLKNLSPSVGKCVEVLKDFQKYSDELEASYLEEKAALDLEAKYQKPLHTKIMNSVVEVEVAPEEVKSEQTQDKSAEEKGLIYAMTRIKRGNIARRRRTKLRLFTLGFQGAHSRLTRIMIQQRIRALVMAHRDRGRRKRDFRRLWITRINGVIQEMKVFDSYNRFIHNLYKKQVLLNRKVLAQIALLSRSCLHTISNEIKKSRLEEIQ